MNEFDDRPVPLKVEDDADVPALVRVETVQPRAVRSQLVALDGRVLAHQDAAEGLLPHIRSQEGRKQWRVLHGEIEETHKLLQGLLRAVERGG
jgi:hypothetical protein